jgi:hypothetical protein
MERDPKSIFSTWRWLRGIFHEAAESVEGGVPLGRNLHEDLASVSEPGGFERHEPLSPSVRTVDYLRPLEDS